VTTVEFTQIDVASWQDFDKLLSAIGVSGWLFRGQQNSEWTLETSLERYRVGVPAREAELRARHAFGTRGHQFIHSPEMLNNAIESLALMQHHGAPTRLLDWTRSPYVAAFFAVQDATDLAGSSAVWAVNEAWCYQSAVKHFEAGFGVTNEVAYRAVYAINWHPSEFAKFLAWTDRDFVIPLEPRLHTERLAIQQGLFLCPANLERPFIANLSGSAPDAEHHIRKFVIPNALRPAFLKQLRLMNINRATLFPGLDGFAESIRHLIVDEPAIGPRRQALVNALMYHDELQRIFGEG
jgi:hypothetical protein